MSFINHQTKEINCKIVYYGPGMGGKCTNMQYIYDTTPILDKGRLISLSTETDRVLFFDYLPKNIKKIKGYKIRIHIYTLPGAVFYNASRALILKGLDGIVYVADSQIERMDSNIDLLWNLKFNLSRYSYSLTQIPYVLQLNKKDLPNAVPTDILKEALVQKGEPVFEAIAYKGQGVYETVNAIIKQVVSNIKNGNVENKEPLPPIDLLLDILRTHPKPLYRFSAILDLKIAINSNVENKDSIFSTLVGTLKEKSNYKGYICAIAADTLGKLGDLRAIDPLTKALNDEYEDTRASAANALKLLMGKESFMLLREAAEDKNYEIRKNVIKDSLLSDKDRNVLYYKNSEVRKSAIKGLGKLGDKRAAEILIQALNDPSVISSAIDSLVELNIQEAYDPIKEILNTNEPSWVKSTAIDALNKLKGEQAFNDIMQVLKEHENEFVRAHAAQILRKINAPKAQQPLFEIFTDKNNAERVRAAALTELFEVMGKEAFDMLIEAVKDKPLVRGEAVKALGKLRDNRAIEHLIPLQKDVEYMVRIEVDNTLKKLLKN